MGMSRMKHVMTDLSDKLESLNLRLPIRITDTFSMSLPEAEGIKFFLIVRIAKNWGRLLQYNAWTRLGCLHRIYSK